VESLDSLLRNAIADRRLVSFTLHDRPRVGEPHDYGIADGVPTLFFYQTGGKSSSGKPLGWRNAVIGEINDLRVLDERFAGTRPAPTGRHKKWDQLYATVSNRK
jgi:hypothetical protein